MMVTDFEGFGPSSGLMPAAKQVWSAASPILQTSLVYKTKLSTERNRGSPIQSRIGSV
jgi:hypothetical protein